MNLDKLNCITLFRFTRIQSQSQLPFILILFYINFSKEYFTIYFIIIFLNLIKLFLLTFRYRDNTKLHRTLFRVARIQRSQSQHLPSPFPPQTFPPPHPIPCRPNSKEDSAWGITPSLPFLFTLQPSPWSPSLLPISPPPIPPTLPTYISPPLPLYWIK